jgi:pterin-4a-carbinolamine dehydratase
VIVDSPQGVIGNLSIVIGTHAPGRLTENDFIVAAKIDQMPVKLR